jgi:hypothetical protein
MVWKGLLEAPGGTLASQQLASCGEHFLRGSRFGEDADAVGGIFGCRALCIAEDKDRHAGETFMHLRHERARPEARHPQIRNDQAKVAGELRLLNHAEGFYWISDPLNIRELLFQRGHTNKGLKRVIVD